MIVFARIRNSNKASWRLDRLRGCLTRFALLNQGAYESGTFVRPIRSESENRPQFIESGKRNQRWA